MTARAWSILCLIAAALAVDGEACGGGSSNTSGLVSCTMAEGPIVGIKICAEAPISFKSQIKSLCESAADAGLASVGANSNFTDGPCSRASALGGCRITSGGMTVTMWYSSVGGIGTTANVLAICTGIGGTYVAP
jgi:hypothetical protein